MEQLHKPFTIEQVKALLKESKCQGTYGPSIKEILEIGKSTFFALLRQYCHAPDTFSVAYQRFLVGWA